MKRLVIGLCLTFMFGCTEKQEVAAAHIRAANQVCENNGGVAKITRAYAQGEVEGCGYRCIQSTGRFLYSANVECKNGAYFHLNFTE